MDQQPTNPNTSPEESLPDNPPQLPPLFDKKKLIPLFIFFVIAVAIIAAFYAAKETILNDNPPEIVIKARNNLADKLGIRDAKEISIKTVTKVNWTDGSLGCPEPGKFYTQSYVKGYLIFFNYQNNEYTYHTNETEQIVFCVDGKPSNSVVCTQDAKLCPDGSYVSRTGPKCEFSTCPTTTTGEFCGGIAAIACPTGFECKLDGDYPDAGGTCVKK